MMNKKLFSTLLMGGLLFSFTGGFVSCSEDYDGDIKDLQTQIDAQKASLAQIEALLQSGVVINDVKSDAEGVKLILSNGKEYILTHGQDGVDGKDGKDAAVWTIETDGYWYLNGEKTEYKAIGIDGKDGVNGTDGVDGKDGADGKDGVDGKDGENGYYYVPNTETGMFDIYQVKEGVGTFVKATEISWRAQCMSAVFTGNKLILSGIKGAENETVTLYVGTGLGSVAFIPEVYSQDFFLPTPKTEYMHINSYAKWGDKVAGQQYLKAKTDIEYSNLVTLSYRLNPSDAFVENTNFGFISRSITTRAAGDKSGNSARIGQVGDATIANGEVNLVTRYNRAGQGNIVALQTWVGQDVVTSDYIYVGSSKSINVYIGKTQQPRLAQYVQRTTANGNIYDDNATTQADAFVKQILPLKDGSNENHNLELKMDETHNLNNYVDLYREGTSSKLSSLGFDSSNFSYKFTMVNYIGEDGKTNQADFASLDAEGNITNDDRTSAETRTPVVRVDAYITDYNGAECLVASAYIKIKWVKDGPTPETPDAAYPTEHLGSESVDYLKLGSTPTTYTVMSWQDVNTKLYDKAGLNSTNFWNYYNAPTYKVTVNDVDNSGKTVKGITVNSNLASDATATSAFSIAVDNSVLTENTYNKRGTAAEYTVTIFIESKNDYDGKGDFTFTYKLYVSENCKPFDFNTLYHRTSYGNLSGDLILVKGQLNNNNLWEMSTYLGEHFKKINGSDIFTYYSSEHKNATAIAFNTTTAGVTIANNTITLNEALTGNYKAADVEYSVTLVNGEVCKDSYKVIFQNPFVSGATQGAILKDLTGVNTTEAAPMVVVNDLDNRTILSNIAGAFTLSNVATDVYKVGMPTVKFEFKKDNAFNTFVGQLADGSVFDIDATSGVITWENRGSKLTENKTFTVVATVTFEDLSVVKCEIPVTIEIK